LFRLLHKTCCAGILPQEKTNIVFSAPLIGNDDRGVFLWAKTAGVLHRTMCSTPAVL